MKKINVILAVVLAAVSAFLLWLWYHLGFNQVDQPLDLVVSVVWWAVIVAGIAAVVKTEQKRQRQIRTMFVADGQFYNSETGLRSVAPGATATASIAGALANLEYGFDKAEEPDLKDANNPIEYKWVVRTDTFKPAEAGSQTGAQGEAQPASEGQPESQETWEGEVVEVATGTTKPFASREELAAIIG